MKNIFSKWLSKKYLLEASLIVSVLLHGLFFITVRVIAHTDTKEYNTSNIKISSMDVDISAIPTELIGGNNNPVKIEKKEWIEGANKRGKDAANTEKDINALSGNNMDGDGYLFAMRGDSPPLLMLDFNVNDFFPLDAKLAKIRKKTVFITVQVDESGILKNARISSHPAGFGFDEAALKIVKLARFRPGYVKGKPVKMNHTVAFKFELE